MPRPFFSAFVFFMAVTVFAPATADAACLSPGGQASHPVFRTADGLQFCADGENWSSLLPTDMPGGAQWDTDGTHVWRTNGHVGIGTATPGSPLSISSNENTASVIRIQNLSDGQSAYAGLWTHNDTAAGVTAFATGGSDFSQYGGLFKNRGFIDTNGDLDGLVLNTEGDDPIIFATQFLERMRIDGSGRIGIGTATPSAPLDIVSTSTGGNAPFLRLQNTSGATLNAFGPGIVFHNGVSGMNGFYMGQEQSAASNFTIARQSAPYTRFLTILQDGKVGIHHTNPEFALDIHGGSAGAGLQTLVRIGVPVAAGAGPLYLTYNAPHISGNSYYDGGWKYGGGTGKPGNIALINGVALLASNAAVGAAGEAITGWEATAALHPTGEFNVSGKYQVQGRDFPWRWHARSTGNLSFGTETWQDVPGATITFTLPSAASVQLSFDTSVMARQPNIHCNLGFHLNGSLMGHSVYGDSIIMGDDTAWWYNAHRTRWVDLPAGTHTVKIQGRSQPAAISAGNCITGNGADHYTAMNVSVIAYPN